MFRLKLKVPWLSHVVCKEGETKDSLSPSNEEVGSFQNDAESQSNPAMNIEESSPSATCNVARDESSGDLTTWQRRRLVFCYMMTTILLYADMNLLAPNLTDIGEEFGFEDSDERDKKLGGHIALGFFLVGAPASFLIGWLTDSWRRGPLLFVTIVVGELGCFMTYFTETYAGLFVCRVITGISVGGSLPIIYSVLGDAYQARSRSAVAAVVSSGTGIGIGLGHGLAGFMGDKYGWRAPFLVVSIPAFFFAILLLAVKEPERGEKERAKIEIDAERQRLARLKRTAPQEFQSHNGISVPEGAELVESSQAEIPHRTVETTIVNDCSPVNKDREQFTPEQDELEISWKTTLEMLKTPTVALILLQGAPACLPFGVAAIYLNDYLNEDRGFTKEEATGVLLSFGAGNALGVIAGGILGHKTYKCDVRYPSLIMAAGLTLSCVPMWFMINNVEGSYEDVDSDEDDTMAPTHDPTNVSIVAFTSLLTGFLVIIPIPIERAILANVTLPESRGRANSFLGIIDDLGKGAGPAIVSLLIDAFDRQTAFSISILGW
eukprot:CAMPEP_0195295422 /NCGR_PEP_ID=MMETSP0707-20130614/17353_1 /TAXON_ID=33640 /ORGANISM="Asterionellopsis glacialis, Strain CCMP134" /LENGTH=548 /DNA_ID=CAMNT_0040356651 /DNA_START=22 /DNA_END=1665 /DNA_ORIENTATION=+